MTKIEQLQEIIDSSENIVFFGGAGVSTESGIPDFRSADGIYSKTPEELVSHTYYFKHTEEFFEFYKENLIFKDAKPNPAHYKLAELEKEGKLKAVITQNIDGLHQSAGSKNVLELHGSVHRNYCQICNKNYDLDYILNSQGIPRCECGGIIKPDVVLYEEPLNNAILSFAVDYISNAETLIIGGTSLVVYPAAGLINYFNGKNLVLINGVSKLYGLTGLRIGWALSHNRELISAMGRMEAQSTSCNSDLSEAAAAAALNGDQSCVVELRKILEENRNALMEEISKIPYVRVEASQGTFYSFADFSHYNADSNALAQYLLEKALVAVVPGLSFGVERYLRISYCADKQSIIEGIRRIRWALDETSPDEIQIGDKLVKRETE